MNATRLYTLKYGGFKQVLSIGRVQTPTLAMLVNRHHEIENFIPQPFWELQTIYRATKFNHTEGKFFTKEDGEKLLHQVTDHDLTITDIERKDGNEYAPKLFDLTSIQVYCNNKFGLTAESTLKLVQKLYEMKVVSYPRVDTTFLPNDMYAKVPTILAGLTNYQSYTESLLGKKIRKSTKVFNDKKVTDHHAIIPTGEHKHLGVDEQKVYDIIVRRFIAAFYPDCKVAKTQVNAVVETVKFVARGKEILVPGWRVIFQEESKSDDDEDKEEAEDILPSFEIGEHGPHEPLFVEKTTKPPNYFTEASLLRAMETAGKQVDDEELRDLMKANGIGRPSTRANIIETLFKRKYSERRKKQVIPTLMGIQLIDTIQNQLLKSAELTGQWEKQLKEIEEGSFAAQQFIFNMKKMVDALVDEVRMETGKPRLSHTSETKTVKASILAKKPTMSCPKCTKGKVLKGSSSFGCSQFKEGCDFRVPFVFLEKKLTDKQIQRIIEKKASTNIKGFLLDGKKTDGVVKLGPAFELILEAKKSGTIKKGTNSMPTCPKCKKGTLIKGNTAYGCSLWKTGCDFKFAFNEIKEKANGKPLTKELVMEIISS